MHKGKLLADTAPQKLLATAGVVTVEELGDDRRTGEKVISAS
jgi:hypothetical protein